MDITYTANGLSDMNPSDWSGSIRSIRMELPYEFLITARGSSFHLIVARHCSSNYICIPDWNIGTDIASLSDSFWNLEHLANTYPDISLVDLISITDALSTLDEYVKIW